MRGSAVLLLAFLSVPSAASSSLRIEAFAPDLPGSQLDDAIWIRNTGPDAVALDDLFLEDGTGRIGFPPGAWLPGRGTVVVAGDAASYRAGARVDPDFALQGLPAGATMRRLRPEFALGQGGDVIRLANASTVIDAIRYGDAGPVEGWSGDPVRLTAAGPLRVHRRGLPADHDAAGDFQAPREHRLGQLETPPLTVPVNGTLLPFVAPEGSRAAVEAAIGLARERLRINVYQFREIGLADLVADRARTKGLRVEVLLDERPVGESSEELSHRGHVIEALEAAGATVRLLRHDRYAYNHAKYIVIDGDAVLVQTENLVHSGVPGDGESGNRGWGVLVESAALAAELGRIFDHDFVVDEFGARAPSEADGPRHPRPLLDGRRGGASPTASHATTNATLLVSPDGPLSTDDPILRLIRDARESLRVVQLNLPVEWRASGGRTWPNPYFEALVDAARRGVAVRVLLDGHFVDSEDGEADNLDTAATIRRFGFPSFQARIVDDGQVLHAKGLVADDSGVLLGSMNWNRNSVLQNREVGLVFDDAGTRLFADVFDADWQRADADQASGLTFVATIITALLVVAARPARFRP